MRDFAALTEVGRARRLRPLAFAALEEYDLAVTGLRLIDDGWNCVFRVETPDGPLALRVTRPMPGRDAASVHSEVAFMTALAGDTDIRVPAIIQNRAGELVTIAAAPGVPEPRSCVVFSWLVGPLLGEQVTARHWHDLGELMGRMHRFAASWTPPADFVVPDLPLGPALRRAVGHVRARSRRPARLQPPVGRRPTTARPSGSAR